MMNALDVEEVRSLINVIQAVNGKDEYKEDVDILIKLAKKSITELTLEIDEMTSILARLLVNSYKREAFIKVFM